MALTIVKTPVSKKLDAVENIGAASNSGGEVVITKTGHTLVNGDFVYIRSPREQYNGYWYVIRIDNNNFKIREYATAANVSFVATGNVSYYINNLNLYWSCVHLPIIFKLQSDKWPVNSVDTARTVSSFSNSNGYTQLLLSGDIKASGSADALEQVEISGTVSLDGVYKILTWNSDISIVIDLTYSASNVFTGGTVQYYYGNYHARIKVYAGLPTGHYWEPVKQYELMAEFAQQPDSTGLVTVNINEFLKQRINIIENNLLLDTLPNNIDAFCYFYIAVAESYDDANQYGTNNLNVSEYVSSYTNSDAFVAANAKLPFKTRSSGALDDYLDGVSAGAAKKFLTGFSQPVLWPGNYFDVSFIIEDSTTRNIERKVYSAVDVLLGTFTDVITNMSPGIYRYPIEQSSFLESYITIQIKGGSRDSEVLRIDVNSECTTQDFYVTWLNHLGGYDYWNFQGETEYGISNIESRTQQKNIFTNWPNSYGEFADSIEKQTSRRTRDTVVLNSQYVDNEDGKLDSLVTILESPLVQKLNSIYDRRTILLGNSSRNIKVDNQKLLMLTVEARYTDENPSQSL